MVRESPTWFSHVLYRPFPRPVESEYEKRRTVIDFLRLTMNVTKNQKCHKY